MTTFTPDGGAAPHDQFATQEKIDHRPDVDAALATRGGSDENCLAATDPMVRGYPAKLCYSGYTTLFCRKWI
ncbi:hypothetical protein [Desulfatitalea alkaliphila]|uniref:Uncharacterized protein n=1 Tax=Desulfatitalea alkaliphila TaxID=2929485 RepID=A0AA41QZ72_9BACT|nr:hypothetical protein [Desulfatitalea alkaliphila]MCJ8499128.1 hypothetical protein [Desulfatitalea alkaliphila]